MTHTLATDHHAPPPRARADLETQPLQVGIAGCEARLDPRGGLWLPAHETLIVADLHLGKGASLSARGAGVLPPHDTAATLLVLAALLEGYAPRTVIALGDSFHDAALDARCGAKNREALRAMISRTERFVWVVGNHDPHPPIHLGGEGRDEVRLGPFVCRHEPRSGPNPGEIAGHLHPCAKVVRRGRAVRRRCFAVGEERIILPAMGAFTGGLNVCDPAYGQYFTQPPAAMMMGKNRIWPMNPAVLAGD